MTRRLLDIMACKSNGWKRGWVHMRVPMTLKFILNFTGGSAVKFKMCQNPLFVTNAQQKILIRIELCTMYTYDYYHWYQGWRSHFSSVCSYFASELELTPKQSLFQVAQIGFVISKCELFDDTTIFFYEGETNFKLNIKFFLTVTWLLLCKHLNLLETPWIWLICACDLVSYSWTAIICMSHNYIL